MAERKRGCDTEFENPSKRQRRYNKSSASDDDEQPRSSHAAAASSSAGHRGEPSGDKHWSQQQDVEEIRAERRRRKTAGVNSQKLKEFEEGNDRFTSGQRSGDAFNDWGVPLDPFNMKAEMQDGTFDPTGNFVWKGRVEKAEEHVMDSWLASIDQGDELSTFKSTEEKQKAALVDSNVSSGPVRRTLTELEALRSLTSLLMYNETPTQAMKRIKLEGHNRQRALHSNGVTDTSCSATGNGATSDGSASNVKLGGKNQVRKRPGALKMDDASAKMFDVVVECCDALLSHGRNVYYEPLDDLQQQLQKLTPLIEEVHQYWQFRLPDDVSIYGPFTSEQLSTTFQTGYFQNYSDTVFRKLIDPTNSEGGATEGPWMDMTKAQAACGAAAEGGPTDDQDVKHVPTIGGGNSSSAAAAVSSLGCGDAVEDEVSSDGEDDDEDDDEDGGGGGASAKRKGLIVGTCATDEDVLRRVAM